MTRTVGPCGGRGDATLIRRALRALMRAPARSEVSPARWRPYNLDMHRLVALIAVGVAMLFGACASEEKEWMKVDAKYTVAEFRRDYSACSKGGRLDEGCMRNKGWVAVSSGGTVAKPTESNVPGPPTGITNR